MSRVLGIAAWLALAFVYFQKMTIEIEFGTSPVHVIHSNGSSDVVSEGEMRLSIFAREDNREPLINWGKAWSL